ncbi:MAG TPA: hypothetical protein VHF25_03820 [Nitriliruptorales bacterium]|nr:hypothetical protein [Nitriliruptorales bacterium]
MARSVHLVGSIPFGTPEEAMTVCLDRLGPYLRTLPDGETGERRDLIVHIVESLRDHPDLELRHGGDRSADERVVTFRVRRGRRLDGRTVDLGHVAAFAATYPRFLQLRARRGRPDLAFQVGIAEDLDMALLVLGPAGPLLHRLPFTVATLREIRAIQARAGDDVVVQLDVPAEVVAVGRAPRPLRPLVAAYLARGITALAGRSPIHARFGVHFCVGDLNHRALARMRDVRPLVLLANAVARRWPQGRPFEYVHVPFAAADHPPPLDADFYAPLVDLAVPADVRFVAGIVHDRRTVEEQRDVLDRIEHLVGRTVDVATACGLGRREPEPAVATMQQAATLCR